MSTTERPARGVREVFRGASWQIGAQLLPLVVNLAATPYIIHGLGAAPYSIYLLVSSLVLVLASLDGGIGQAALRYFSIFAGHDDRIRTTRLLISASAAVAALWLLVSVVVLALTPTVLRFFRLDPALQGQTQLLLSTLVVMLGPVLIRNIFNAVLFSRGRFEITSVAYVAGHLTFTLGAIISIHTASGLSGIAVSLVVQQLIVSVITVPVATRYLSRRGLGVLPRAEALDFAGYSLRAQVSGLVLLMTGQKDQLVAGRLLSAQESGPYGQGTNFSTQLRSLPYTAVGPMQSLVGRAIGAQTPAAAVTMATDLQRLWVRAVTGWGVIGIPAVYYGVRAWLPDAYAAAGPVTAMLVAGHFFPLAASVTLVWILSLGHAAAEMRSVLAGLVINVAGTAALGAAFGMPGVVASTVLAQAATAGFLAWTCRRVCDVRPPVFLREVPLAAAVAGLVVCAATQWLAQPVSPRGALGLLTAASLAAPALAVYVFCAFDRDDRRRLRQLLRSRIR